MIFDVMMDPRDVLLLSEFSVRVAIISCSFSQSFPVQYLPRNTYLAIWCDYVLLWGWFCTEPLLLYVFCFLLLSFQEVLFSFSYRGFKIGFHNCSCSFHILIYDVFLYYVLHFELAIAETGPNLLYCSWPGI